MRFDHCYPGFMDHYAISTPRGAYSSILLPIRHSELVNIALCLWLQVFAVMDWSTNSKMNGNSSTILTKHSSEDEQGQKCKYVERTQYGSHVELHIIEHHPRLCMEYVVTSPKFSVKTWLLWTSFFNILGFALKLHTQVYMYIHLKYML